METFGKISVGLIVGFFLGFLLSGVLSGDLSRVEAQKAFSTLARIDADVVSRVDVIEKHLKIQPPKSSFKVKGKSEAHGSL